MGFPWPDSGSLGLTPDSVGVPDIKAAASSAPPLAAPSSKTPDRFIVALPLCSRGAFAVVVGLEASGADTARSSGPLERGGCCASLRRRLMAPHFLSSPILHCTSGCTNQAVGGVRIGERRCGWHFIYRLENAPLPHGSQCFDSYKR